MNQTNAQETSKGWEKELHRFLNKFLYAYTDIKWRPSGEDIEVFIKQLLLAQKLDLKKKIEGWADEQIRSMEVAIKTNSEAGAGYTIGNNALVDDLQEFLKTI